MKAEDLVIVGLLVSGFIGCLIGAMKNRKVEGLIAGLFLGPIGWIIMLFAKEPQLGARPFSIIGILTILAAIIGSAWFMHATRWERGVSTVEEDHPSTPRPHLTEVTSISSPPPTVRRTPTPQETAQEIARKYSSPK